MSDIDNKVTLTVTVEDSIANVERTDKPQFMLDSDYDLNTLFGTCSLMAHFAKLLTTTAQKPEQLIDKMASLAKSLL